MKNFWPFLILILSVVNASCTKDYELRKSVFIPDSDNPNLPAYSEWGYNTFGAYYERNIFISNNYIVPAKIISTDTAMSFILSGQLGMEEMYSDYTEMTMTFVLPGLSPSSYADLTILNDSIVDLTNPDVQVQISTELNSDAVLIPEGQLNFNHVRILYVDEGQTEAILSGYFDFKAVINEIPVSVYDGRFDVGISNYNFFNF